MTSNRIYPGATAIIAVTLIAYTIQGAFSRYLNLFYMER